MRFFISILVMAALCVLCSTAFGGDGPLDPNGGLRVWALGDVTGEGQQELRIGWEGLLPDVELAIAGIHRDAPEDGTEDWPIRGYAIAHALDTEMIGSFMGQNWTLPEGTLYVGGGLEYSHDRPNEWSGLMIWGGVMDWPRGWQTVAEYQKMLFNTDREDDLFVVGLRRAF